MVSFQILRWTDAFGECLLLSFVLHITRRQKLYKCTSPQHCTNAQVFLLNMSPHGLLCISFKHTNLDLMAMYRLMYLSDVVWYKRGCSNTPFINNIIIQWWSSSKNKIMINLLFILFYFCGLKVFAVYSGRAGKEVELGQGGSVTNEATLSSWCTVHTQTQGRQTGI